MEMMILSILAPALHCHWQITQVQQASLTTVVFLGKKIGVHNGAPSTQKWHFGRF